MARLLTLVILTLAPHACAQSPSVDSNEAEFPQVYNVSQTFSTAAGQSYLLSASAAEAVDEDDLPDCALKICVQKSCSPAFGLGAVNSTYSYQYTATTTNEHAVAIFSIQCVGPADVALDMIATKIVASDSSVLSSAPNNVTVFATQTILQTTTIQETIRDLITTTMSCSSAATPTPSRQVEWLNATEIRNVITTVTRTINSAISPVTVTSTESIWYTALQNASTTTVTTTQQLTITQESSPENVTLRQVTQTMPPTTERTFVTHDRTVYVAQTSEVTTTVSRVETTTIERGKPAAQTRSVETSPPSIALASPTAIVGDINGAPSNVDDEAYPLVLPFEPSLFGQSSSTVYVTSNGVVGWTTANGNLENGPLPGFVCDTGALAFWDDLIIYEGTQQGIYYQIRGDAPDRLLIFEFYMSKYDASNEYYHFLVSFAEAVPNMVSYQYLNVSDHGGSATVGVQSVAAGNLQVTYSINQAVIYPGMTINLYTGTTGGSYMVTSPGDNTPLPAVLQQATKRTPSRKDKLAGWLKKTAKTSRLPRRS